MVHRFELLDYAVFVAYLVASVLVGVLFVKENKSAKDFFVAGRSMGSFPVAISILAALFSGITFLGGPAEVYKHDLSFALIALSFFIATPLTNLVFVPRFYKSLYTAYEFLEVHMGIGMRKLSAFIFVVRVMLWLSLATYAPALALQQATGFPLAATIILTAVLTTAYTTLGGMKAVIWTDVMQFIVLFGGQLLVMLVAMSQVPGGFAGVLDIGAQNDKLTVNFSLDPNIRVTFWGLVIGGAFLNLVQMVTDQVSVQRYLSARSIQQAQRSLWIKLAFTIPVLALFYFTGLVLFAFYQSHPDPMANNLVKEADQVLPFFVVSELRSGLPGLFVAAIFAASMSTISAGLNSLATTTLSDVLPARVMGRKTEGGQLLSARYLTVLYGLLVLGGAFVVPLLGSLLEASNKALGMAGGPMLGVFLLAATCRKAGGAAGYVGWAAGVVALVPVVYGSSVSFLWYAAIGAVTTWAVGWIASLVWPRPETADA